MKWIDQMLLFMVLPNVLPSLYLNRASLMGEIAECLYSAIDNLNYEWQVKVFPDFHSLKAFIGT